jgi:GNAT superfamily N-acetyltransferase
VPDGSANSGSIRFRPATPGDIPALEELIPLSMRALGASVYTPEELEIVLMLVGVDRQLIEDGTYFVAEDGGRIVACGGWSNRKKLYGGEGVDAAPALLDPATDAARIRAFFVHPERAGQRLGSRLLDLCETAARDAGFKRIELGATRPGEALYAKHGYRYAEEIVQKARDGRSLPLMRMVKDL